MPPPINRETSNPWGSEDATRSPSPRGKAQKDGEVTELTVSLAPLPSPWFLYQTHLLNHIPFSQTKSSVLSPCLCSHVLTHFLQLFCSWRRQRKWDHPREARQRAPMKKGPECLWSDCTWDAGVNGCRHEWSVLEKASGNTQHGLLLFHWSWRRKNKT